LKKKTHSTEGKGGRRKGKDEGGKEKNIKKNGKIKKRKNENRK
jgi:hypothetical protein